MDPNCYARVLSEMIWSKLMQNPSPPPNPFSMFTPFVPIFILICNFFFAILPGVLYFATNVRIVQEEDSTIDRELPNVQKLSDWFALLFIIFPLFVSVFQIFKFHRLISFRMTRTFLFGQIISSVLYLCCFSKPFLRKFIWFPRKQTILGLTIIFILIIYPVLFLPWLFTYSEFATYLGHPCYMNIKKVV